MCWWKATQLERGRPPIKDVKHINLPVSDLLAPREEPNLNAAPSISEKQHIFANFQLQITNYTFKKRILSRQKNIL